MNKSRIIFLAFTLCIFSANTIWSQEKSNLDNQSETDNLKIIVTSFEIGDKALNMTYEIINRSEEDAWILTGICQLGRSTFGMSAGVYFAKDGQTLMIGSRINVQLGESYMPYYGRFVRLGSGQSQTESIFIELPINSAPQSGPVSQQGQGLQYTTKLAIEYSYYSGDLPEILFRTSEEQEKNRPADSRGYNLSYLFSSGNECLSSRDDELLIMWGGLNPRIAREKVLRTVVDNVRIPYKGMSEYKVVYERPKSAYCTKVEINYYPSMLDYFFPFAFQQNLLSLEELGYLQSHKSIVLKDTKKIMALADDVGIAHTKFTIAGTLSARYRSRVDVTYSYDSKPQTSFFIYNDDRIGFDGGFLPCTKGFPGLKIVTPRIQSIDLRMRCAVNLKNQWYRFRIYHFYEARHLKNPSLRKQMIYPTPTKWCDDILRSYPKSGFSGASKEMHVCPSAGEGKNHYAMNPNCEPNSPGDMVLLFETKAGWNQHGGPELFTFDNHDPKGGCVLLNNGTVKFIRTEQELNALKWK